MTTDLLELERRRCAAFDALDIDELVFLTTEDYMHIHSVGIFDRSREEYIKTLGTRTPGRYQTERGDLMVREDGDVAYVVGPFHVRSWHDGGLEKEVFATASGVWRRMDEGWKLQLFQVTKTPE